MRRMIGLGVAGIVAAALAAGAGAAGMPQPRLLAADGGRVAWYHGQSEKHELIAYDMVANPRNKDTELYVINPDGSGKSCVTCNATEIPKGFVGQPEWHPDGEHIVIQVENANSKHGLFNHMSWGFDNDLWLIKRDGTGAQRIFVSEPGHAALHPHFSDDGNTLIFAERIPTGKKLRRLVQRMLAPDGENPWDGWRIHVATLEMRNGTASLSNHRTFTPNGPGFYETHQIHNGRIVYSHTPDGLPYVANVYEANMDGSGVKNLTNQNGTWNEHGIYSPDGRSLAFISSRWYTAWHYPGSRAQDLKTELYVQPVGGQPERVTDMNARGPAVAVSDYDWDRESRRIVVQVAELSGRTPPQLFVLTVR